MLNCMVFVFLILVGPSFQKSIGDFHNYEKIYFIRENATAKIPREANVLGFVEHLQNGLRFTFRAFNRTFVIQAATGFARLPNMDPSAIFFTANGSNSTGTLTGDFFIGRHLGHPRCTVEGYLLQNLPRAMISCPDETYVVEPAELLFKSFIGFNAVCTRQSDAFRDLCDGVPCFKIDTTPHEEQTNISEQNRYAEYEVVRPIAMNQVEYHQDKVCGAHVVADHTFANFHRGNEFVIRQEMISWLRTADNFLSRTDFNGDGYRDNIRLQIRKLSILHPETPGYDQLADPNIPVDITLQTLSRWSKEPENGEFCMVVVYVHRDWKTTNGVAYLGKPLPNLGGGVCHLIGDPHSSQHHSRLNVAVMTNVVHGQIRPHINMGATTTHEVGHAFGAPHDNEQSEYGANPPCKFEQREMQFMMNSFSGEMVSQRNQIFSPCSISRMLPVIRNKAICLEQPIPPRCGDGIVQEGEECDCGDTEQQCHIIDHCCTAASEPFESCRVARHRGHDCSPATSPCCDLGCQIESNPEVQCSFTQEDECRLFSRCNGIDTMCPDPPPAPDGTPCNQRRFVCNGGVCGHTGCAGAMDYHLCRCGPPDECTVCCYKPGFACVPAHTLNLPDVQGQLVLGIGTQCGEGGFCDKWGNCRLGFSYSISDRLELAQAKPAIKSGALWMLNNWYFLVMGLIFVVVIVLVAIGCRNHRRGIRKLQRFELAVEESVKKLKKQQRRDVPGPNVTEVGRLWTMFPSVHLGELVQAYEKNKAERYMVRTLLASGHPIRMNYDPSASLTMQNLNAAEPHKGSTKHRTPKKSKHLLKSSSDNTNRAQETKESLYTLKPSSDFGTEPESPNKAKHKSPERTEPESPRKSKSPKRAEPASPSRPEHKSSNRSSHKPGSPKGH